MDTHVFKKRVVLFGAGASIPFFSPALSTRFLTEKLRDRETWDSLVDRYNTLMKGKNEINSSVVLDAIHRIVKLNPEINFEEIIEIIDKITSYNFDDGDNKIFHTLLKYFRVKCEEGGHVWDNVPFLCRQLIAEAIIDIQKKCRSNNFDVLQKSQSKFIDFLLAEESTSIFSLNYDDVLPQAIAESDLSFQVPNNFRLGYFDVQKYMEWKYTVAYPHGHIRFVKDDNGISYYEDSDEANRVRLENLSSITLNQTKTLGDSKYAYNFNTFIVTGQSKESTFDENPYAAYYLKLANDLCNCDELIIIGYSFGDEHFNRLFLNFLSLKRTNKVLIVAKHDSDIDIIPEFMDTNSEISKILHKHDQRHLLLDAPNGGYKYQSDVDGVNLKGYGMLIPQVYYYKNGYEKFLSEFGFVLRQM